MDAPAMLNSTGKAKWVELCEKRGEPQGFEYDIYLQAAAAWEAWHLCHADVIANGPAYRDTKNGRVWNNPNVNNAASYAKQFQMALKILGLLPNGEAIATDDTGHSDLL